MALQFKPLKLDNPDLFGVGLAGSVGLGDNDRLKELAEKCLLNGKVRLVLDFSELGSMGGRGARMIAELQDCLVAAEGEAVIAGAGETVKRFLDQKLEEKSITYYETVEDAVSGLAGAAGTEATKAVGTAVEDPPLVEEDQAAPESEEEAELEDDQLGDEVGAIGFAPEEDPNAELDDLLGEFKVPDSPQGRRKDHHFTSLGEALDVLGGWSDRQSQMAFNDALKNLLFSQGLAEDVTLLVAQGGLLLSPDGYKEIPLDGSLALQAEEMARPLTMLDVIDDGLEEEEISLLEALDPDLILPILRHDVLSLLILVKKGGDEREYSVAENFAFELLQQILEKHEEDRSARTTIPAEDQVESSSQETAPATAKLLPGNLEEDISTIMLHMALEMPEADDLPHFWRLFARHLKPQLQLGDMALLIADGGHPRIMLGGDDALAGLDCSEARLRKYFRTMELPVHISNVPDTFADVRKQMKGQGVQWLVALKDEQEYLGTVFFNGTTPKKGEFPDKVLNAFELAGRLMARFVNQNEGADTSLELLFRLMSQREKRYFNSAEMTTNTVQQLNLLAQEMGFPPDQKRALITGCLLRDTGLIDKEDTLMGSPAEMSPAQWKSYRKHPAEGIDLLQGLNLSQTALEVVRYHHERFNGEGFPDGLSGRDIPLPARVVTVVENYVAMITGAGGLEPKSPEQAAAVLRENLGERYDPDIVGIFLSVVGKTEA